MATIITRETGATAKGSPLTNAEVDNNFINLNTEVTPARATIRPALTLDFAGSKTVDSRVNFTRNSSAMHYANSGILTTKRGDQPRIDFDASTGDCKGLLIEESRTNTHTLYQNYNIPGLEYGMTVIPNATIAPDGTMTGYLARPDGTSTSARLLGSIDAAGTWTTSIYAKQGASSSFGVWIYAGGWVNTGSFVWVNGELQGQDAATRKTECVGNGWYRAIITYTTTSGGSIVIGAGPYSVATAADSTYFWGLQTESGAYATSYIQTSASFTSRASAATYFDSTGTLRIAGNNQLRTGYAYDNNSGKWVLAGPILEQEATNITPALQFYTVVNATLEPSSIVAPDGTTSALKYSYASTAGDLYRYYSKASSAIRYTQSVYVKGTANTFNLYLSDNTTGQASGYYNLSALTATATSGTWGNAQATITPIGNGWYRCTLSATSPANGAVLIGVNGMPTNTYLYLYGIQFETGSMATSYIPTYTSAVTRAGDSWTSAATTRAADVAVIKENYFSKLNSSSAATLYGEGTSLSGSGYTGSSPALATLSNTLDRDTHRMVLRRHNMSNDAGTSGFNYRLATVINGVSYSIDSAAGEGVQPDWEDTAVHKMAFGADLTSQQGYGDGYVGTVTSVTIPTLEKLNQMEIGYGGSSAYWNGHIRKIVYFNKRVSNAQLQALTK